MKDVPLVKFMHLVFTCMPGENYARRFRSVLLCPLLLMWCLPSTVNIYPIFFFLNGGTVDTK